MNDAKSTASVEVFPSESVKDAVTVPALSSVNVYVPERAFDTFISVIFALAPATTIVFPSN